MKKHALFLVNEQYADMRLASLPLPGRTFSRLAEAMLHPGLGGFTRVEILRNPDIGQALHALDRFFSQTPPGDLAIAYFSGHGFMDAEGEVFLALRDSDRYQLKSTALTAEAMGMAMDRSPSQHKLLILDCRFQAPFPMARNAEVRLEAGQAFAGRGLPKTLFCASVEVDTPEKKVAYPAAWDFTHVLAEALEADPDPSGKSDPLTLDGWWRAALKRMATSGNVLPIRYRLGDPEEVVIRSPVAQAELAHFPAHGAASTGQVPSEGWSELSDAIPLDSLGNEVAVETSPSPHFPPPVSNLLTEMQQTIFFPAPDRLASPRPKPPEEKMPPSGFGRDAMATLMVTREEFIEGALPSGETVLPTAAGEGTAALRWSRSLEVPESTLLKKLGWILVGLLPLGLLLAMYGSLKSGWVADSNGKGNPKRESHADPAQPIPTAPPTSSARPALPAKPTPTAQPAPTVQPAPTTQPTPTAQASLTEQPAPIAQPTPSAQPLPTTLPPETQREGDAVLKARLQEALRRSSPDIQALYDRFLMGFPGLKGEIVVTLTVDPNGRLLHVSVRNSTTGVPRFDAEILRLAETWRLGPFPGKTAKRLTVPLRFPSH